MTQLSTSIKIPALREFIVAIDPGKNVGVCFWRRKDEKVIYSGTKVDGFYDVQLFIARSFKDRSLVKIYVEHPPTFMYARNDVAAGPVRDRKQQMQAANRREAELLAVCLRGRGFEVELVPPVREKKWTQEHFTLFTSSHKRTSEHERDAIRLAVFYANWRKELKR